MSKGSPIICIRLHHSDLTLLDAFVALSNTRRRDEPDTRSSWVRRAVQEKLKKMARSARRQKAQRRTGPEGEGQAAAGSVS